MKVPLPQIDSVPFAPLVTVADSFSVAPVRELPYHAPGWHAFTDLAFMADTLLTLTLAALLGAVIAFHPKNREGMKMFEGIDSLKVYVLFPVIGAIIGIMVVNYGLVVGFVLFGIGGLIRFRTVLRSASLTGRVIFATLIGLACGLRLPHVAVLATAFGFAVIYILDASVAYRIDINALPPEHIAEAIGAYRQVLEEQGCQVLRMKENCEKSRVTFLLACPSGGTVRIESRSVPGGNSELARHLKRPSGISAAPGSPHPGPR